MTPEELKARTKAGMIADLRLPIEEPRIGSGAHQRGGRTGGHPYPFAQDGESRQLRREGAMCRSIDNRQSTIGNSLELVAIATSSRKTAKVGKGRQLRRENLGSRSIDNRQSKIGN
jgi:hypothetical protein